ncbi:MAG: hypothetical protein WBF93_02140 [Pirellulales bacterium]
MMDSRLVLWQQRNARLMLVLVALTIVVGVAVTLAPIAQGFADKQREGANDIALYQAEVDRIRAGETYYAATAAELVPRGYPTRSVFNWRTPLPMWLIGILPDPVFGKALLGGLAIATMLLAFEWTAREGGRLHSALCIVLMAGGFLPCFLSNLYVMPVLWAGTLIALSVCALGIGRNKLGIACGIAAVFVRDLAGPYCVLGMCVAVWQRRWKEAGLWFAGLAAYGLFFLWHCAQVDAWRLPEATSHAQGWLQFGGLPFLLSTVQMNSFLLILPQWVTAIYFPLALLGFASWATPAGRYATLTALTFVMLFAMVGLEINQYWGALTAPLLCLGAARSPIAILELLEAANWSWRPAFAQKPTA